MKFGLPDLTVSKFLEVFAHYPEILEVIIYGSRAKGNHREGSDIDLTLKGPDLNDSIRSRVWLDLDNLNTPYKIDLSIFDTLPPGSLKDHIERIGRTFYEKSQR